MKNYKTNIIAFIVVVVASSLSNTFAQVYSVPLEIKQTKIKLNTSAYGGMPIKPLKLGTLIGSNGNQPTTTHQEGLNLTTEVPFNGNFVGATILPGGWRTEKFRSLNDRSNDAKGQTTLGWNPKTTSEGIFLEETGIRLPVKMRWASIGAPLVSRQTSYLLGNRISPPSVNEFGIPLVDIEPKDYWRAMPHELYEAISASVISRGSGYKIGDVVTLDTTNQGKAAKFEVTDVDSLGAVKSVRVLIGATYLGKITGVQSTSIQSGGGNDDLTLDVKFGFTKFYWSPHADAVFATQPGVIPVTWIRRESVTVPNPDLDSDDYHQPTVGGGYFALLNQSYVVSGAPSKAPKTIYWTEKQYNGPLVQIPNSQINAVKIVYNSNFPKDVAHEVSAISESSRFKDQSQTVQETRTLWYEFGSLHAYNAEGRVFVEYLGSMQKNDLDRVHLGFDIVNVEREARPENITVDLGDPITPGIEEDLYPKQIIRANFDKPHLFGFTGDDGVHRLYAARKTDNLNDVLVYWMSKGEHGIQWPSIYTRYTIQWPLEASKYSHYARAFESEPDAMLSAVQLPSDNNPILQYQSEEDLNLATITADQKFYVHLSVLTEHRSLIRYMREGEIWFERVYSFRDTWVEDLDGILSDSISIYEISTSNGTVTVKTGASSSSTVEHGFSNGDDFTISGASPSVYNGTHTVVSTTHTQFTFKMDGSPSLGTTGIVTKKPIPKKYSGILGIDWFMGDNKPAASERPAHFSSDATVGRRIVPPAKHNGLGNVLDGDYLAGHIHTARGTSYNPNAYIDPMEKGFEEANQGAIIPVNAIPGQNKLEVWWFRKSERDGFKPVYWPSVVATYTIQWPHEMTDYKAESTRNAIVLASNDGSGPLNSLQAKGNIYYENNPNNPGYNPNEEHALMIAGQAYALRDDLNIHRPPHSNYSSSPYVLLEFTDEDGRPNMRAFEVIREQPELGITFEYEVEAGTILQPPMPLPIMEKPLVERDQGKPPVSLNEMIPYLAKITSNTSSKTPTADINDYFIEFNTEHRHSLREHMTASLQSTKPSIPSLWFYFIELKAEKIVKGFVSDTKPIKSDFETEFQTWHQKRRTYALDDVSDFTELSKGDKVAVISSDKKEQWLANFHEIDTRSNTVELEFLPDKAPEGTKANGLTLAILKKNISVDEFAEFLVGGEILPSNLINESIGKVYSNFSYQDRKGNLWVYRGPHKKSDNSWFQVQHYYKTQEGFAFPGVYAPPPAGTITPYLRAELITNNEVVGHTPDSTYTDRVMGDADNDKNGDGNSLAVTYRPKWPDDVPVLRTAQTLTKPVFGLPAVRGQTSLEVLYQQSQTDGDGDTSKKSVILHDPTREKEYRLAKVEREVLHKIPDSVKTEIFRGKTYFPNLPPHLVKRFFYDPNRGENGALVFKGEFVDEVVGEDYLLLNVAGVNDLAALKNLCLDSDDSKKQMEKNKWNAAIEQVDETGKVIGGLKATLELFEHNDSNPGNYHASDESDQEIYINSPVEVISGDQAVDSYALTAHGSGVGYVTLIAGNGLAFTPADEPVSLHVIKVVPELHPGEIKAIVADNPLSEKMTMQQVVDFAGKPDKFDFEWRISPPDDGKAPQIYEMTSTQLLADGTWKHVAFPFPTDFNTDGKVKNDAYFGSRARNEVTTQVKAVSEIEYTKVVEKIGFPKQLQFESDQINNNRLTKGVKIRVQLRDGTEIDGTVESVGTDSFSLSFSNRPAPLDVEGVFESIQDGEPQSIVYREFKRPKSSVYLEFCLSMNINDHLGAEVYIDGSQVVRANLDTGNTESGTPPGSIQNALRYSWILPATQLSGGVDSGDTKTHRVVVKLYSNALPGVPQDFNLRLHGVAIEDLVANSGAQWKELDPNKYLDGVRAVIGGKADVQTLSDNYLTMRYRAKNLIEVTSQVTEADTEISIKALKSDLKAKQTLYFEGGQFTLNEDVDSSATSLKGKYKGENLVQGSEGSDFHPDSTKWSQWTQPQLAEGWIKRVLAGINPFHQRAKNLFNNRVDTGVSMLTQAGPRWEGDVALNMDSINDFGLIEIYETVLNRGKMLSIGAGINYGPANDALLLVAGYMNDLYTFLGNEASADAANPTIGIGTTDGELGSVATSLFAFKGQVPSLLEEELGLLRGRDDFLQPGVRTAPAYNRFYWNYTRGIDAGEVIYALNYNITEDEDQGFDGLVDAEDAQKMYPQGHGDAYGHYLTALKGYYQLLVDEDFTWVPRTEAVLVLGKPVQVDYLDERKFATAAAAVARTGNQVVELTWRKDYNSQKNAGWEHFASTRYNSRNDTTRHWGVDQWASRTGSGSYLNWVAGNAMLPDEDPNSEHEGIQKIDRQTVPELLELATIGEDLQVTMDNAEKGMNPLGLNENSIAMDIDPHFLEAGSGTFTLSHFDQIYTRALAAMNNATSAFDNAKGVTEMMRSEENSLSDFQAEVAGEELAYKHELIELYGTPYPDDIEPGKTYPQGYDGPDLTHYMYVDINEQSIKGWIEPEEDKTFMIDKQKSPWDKTTYDTFVKDEDENDTERDKHLDFYEVNTKYDDIKTRTKGETHQALIYNVSSHGFTKPKDYKGKRSSPGEIQSAISNVILANNGLREALENHQALKYQLDREIEVFKMKIDVHKKVRELKGSLLALQTTYDTIEQAYKMYDQFDNNITKKIVWLQKSAHEAIPKNIIAGMAAGGDVASAARAAALAAGGTPIFIKDDLKLFLWLTSNAAMFGNREIQRWLPHHQIGPAEWSQELREGNHTLDMSFGNVQMSVFTINEKIQELDEAQRAYQALLASGERIQATREIFRQRSSAIVQGMRTRDAGFRIIRNEKLERYKTLYDLAARYTYLTAKAYDYETGLLHTGAGKDFLGPNRRIRPGPRCDGRWRASVCGKRHRRPGPVQCSGRDEGRLRSIARPAWFQQSRYSGHHPLPATWKTTVSSPGSQGNKTGRTFSMAPAGITFWTMRT